MTPVELADKLADAAAHWRTKEFDDLCHANTDVIVAALRALADMRGALEEARGYVARDKHTVQRASMLRILDDALSRSPGL